MLTIRPNQGNCLLNQTSISHIKYFLINPSSLLLLLLCFTTQTKSDPWPISVHLLHEMSRAASNFSSMIRVFCSHPTMVISYLHNQFSPDRIRNYSARIYIYLVLTKTSNTKYRQLSLFTLHIEPKCRHYYNL